LTGVRAGAAATEYFRVNEALNRIFFGGRFKLLPVYLDLEDDLIGEAATLLQIGDGDCREAIASATAATLHTGPGQSPYTWHLSVLNTWADSDRSSGPPSTALLTTLALAAERMREDAHYSAQNYYERLFEILGITDDTYKNRLKQSAYQTKDFWEALNAWLTEGDFDLGRPTAKPINNWQFAGYPLSQALVRKADRQRMHACFAERGLAPHEKLTEGEMSQYLHDWIRTADASPWLRRIWANFDLRPRVTAAACAELETWDGGQEDGEDELRKRRLSWTASHSIFPKPNLRLYLSAASDGGGVAGVTLQSSASAAAKAAFEETGGQMWLSPSHDGAISVLEPISKIALNPLMLATFDLEAPEAGLKFSRGARSIIPLVRPDTGPYYREVSRVSFLRSHLILCHQKWRDAAAALLRTTARVGFREWGSHDLPGLPPEWVLFSGVEILRHAETGDTDLSALTPLAEGIAIEISGGLRLAQGIYHCRAAPEVTASAAEGALQLRVRDAREQTLLETNKRASSHSLDLASAGPWLPEAYTIEAEAGAAQRSAQISFRSADAVKPVPPGTLQYAYALTAAAPHHALSATTAAPADAVSVQGMIVCGLSAPTPATSEVRALDVSAEGEDEPLEPEGDYQLHQVSGLEEACLLRGHHKWDVDYVPPGADPHAPVWMKCRDCSLRVLSAANRWKRARAFGRNQAPRRVSERPIMKPRVLPQAPPTLVYDALCYLSSGSWSRLSEIVSTGGAGGLSAHVWSSNLSALGFLDITYDGAVRAPASWSVPAPAIVFTSPTRAFLSGFRNDALRDELRERLCSNGAVETVRARGEAPEAIYFNGLRQAECAELIAPVRDGRGRPVAIAINAGLEIAQAHPPASAFERTMGPIGIDTAEGLKQFDPASASWRQADNARTPGAYRADYAGRTYFIVGEDGSMKSGPYWLVKLLAARRSGVRLHGYDLSLNAFQAVLGCALPPLLERALAASTGELPIIERGKLIYENVPRDLAAHILAKLYS